MIPQLPELAQRLESYLKSVINSQQTVLSDLLASHFGWGNQSSPDDNRSPIPHFEPLLCMYLSESLGNDPGDALHLAGALELTANFVEIHNDVQNGGQGARPDSIWWTWGPAQAINAGDGLHALARTTILNHPSLSNDHILNAVKALDNACLSLFEGQFTDINFRDQMEIREEEFLEMLNGKAGSLSSCALFMAVLTTTDNSADIDSYCRVGQDIGVALQITKDIEAIWGPDNTGITRDNLMLRRKTLPLVRTLSNADETTKRTILNAYMSRIMDDDAGTLLTNLMTESGAKDYAENKAQSLLSNSLNELRVHNPHISDGYLDAIVHLYREFARL